MKGSMAYGPVRDFITLWGQTILVVACVLFLGQNRGEAAPTYITYASSAPVGTQPAVEASIEAQWTTALNPFFPDTLKIYGPNPLYNPPVTNADLLNAIMTVDSYTYVYGWAQGMQYERNTDIGTLDDFVMNCSSPTFFGVVAIDTTTCVTVLEKLGDDIYTQNFSTPTIIPGF